MPGATTFPNTCPLCALQIGELIQLDSDGKCKECEKKQVMDKLVPKDFDAPIGECNDTMRVYGSTGKD